MPYPLFGYRFYSIGLLLEHVKRNQKYQAIGQNKNIESNWAGISYFRPLYLFSEGTYVNFVFQFRVPFEKVLLFIPHKNTIKNSG